MFHKRKNLSETFLLALGCSIILDEFDDGEPQKTEYSL